MAGGNSRGGCPGRKTELAQDVGHVTMHSVLTDDQPVRYLTIGQPLGDQPQDLAFAWAQPVQRPG